MNARKIFFPLTLATSMVLLGAAGCSKANTPVTTTATTTDISTNVPTAGRTIDLTNSTLDVNGVNTNIPITTVGPAAKVNVSSSGFSPEVVTIKVGQTVTWTNTDSVTLWPAVDPHPVHTDLSGFDSKGLAPGESYSYTFLKIGTWTYHDHLFPLRKGTVVVQ